MIAQRYTVHHLPACRDWRGNEYPERYGVTLTLQGNPIRIDGGEFATRDAAVAAGDRYLGTAHTSQ